MLINSDTILFLGEVIAALVTIGGAFAMIYKKLNKPQQEIKGCMSRIEKNILCITESIKSNQEDIKELRREIGELKQTNKTLYYITNTLLDIVYKSNQSNEIKDIKKVLTNELIDKATN